MNYNELKKYCKIIYGIAGKEFIYAENVSNETISDYYSKSAFYFEKFHSSEGAMHLPISFSDKTPHKIKLLYQADLINEVINKYDYCNVLELGCGMGFNTNYLAKKNPSKKFTGLDLTSNNIKKAKLKSKELNNTFYYQHDFDKASIVDKDIQYDLIFAIETLCYSKNIIELINNLRNKLSENGRIIIFDGYVKCNAIAPTKEFEKRAYRLLSWGFALNKFQNLDDILRSEKLFSLNIEHTKDYTENILSNYLAFQKGAKKALSYPFLLKILLKTRIISVAVIKQISAGVLVPYFLDNGYLGYYRLELTK